jgi:hypothetical protein
MTKIEYKRKAARVLAYISMMLIAVMIFATDSNAQTAGGTVISNQAAASYSDGTNNFTTVSNTVTVTVAKVSGLTITTNATSPTTLVAGQTGVLYSFRVNNIGNFADQVRFLASGASIQLSSTGSLTGTSITRAVIDSSAAGANAGVIDAGDTNIFTNGADVLSASIAQNGYVDVLVEVSVGAAAAGDQIRVQLGDATTDNQATASPSTHEVRTETTPTANGTREAVEIISATVQNNAQLQLGVTYPAGPVALGSDITYGWTLCNTGARSAQSMTLGGTTGIFIVAPVPAGTTLKSGQTFTNATTVLYTNSPLTTAPTAATWTTTPSGTVTRVAFSVGSTLAAPVSPATSNCASAINMVVTITTTNATNDIYEIGDAFANNSLGSQVTDQSGDLVSNAGDGNANFDETNVANDGNGYRVVTILTRTGSVLIGPSGAANANGPTSNNDDYTNRSVTTGIAGIAFGSNTDAAGTIVFTNTISNTGNANDTYVISRQSAPTGFTVEVSTDNGATYTTLTNNTVSLPVNFGSTANVLVRVTAPAGQAVMSAYPVVIRTTSTTTPSAFNETIDRLYTGAFRMTKSSAVVNTTGVGGATDPVPGAFIDYTIVYTNITSLTAWRAARQAAARTAAV